MTDDITDDDVAAIRAESAAYDLAHPNWREEAEARRAAWRKNRMPDGLKAKSQTATDPELKQWMSGLRDKLMRPK
jgi:hypothetical protein